MEQVKRILLHACCAPCSTHCVEFLRKHGLEPTLFFSNSNISPESEYTERLNAVRKFADFAGVELIEDTYDNASWTEDIRGFEAEPEGGARCRLCFLHNLRRTARYAAENGFSEFTTTLTVSPHKHSKTIFEAGYQAAADVNSMLPANASRITFAEYNFKKQDGFLNSVRLSEKQGLYRQNYCGCYFSRIHLNR